MSPTTTLPAPMTEFSPIVMPGPTIAPPPIQTFWAMTIGSAYSSPAARCAESVGCVAA
jgi:hypothetical protein